MCLLIFNLVSQVSDVAHGPLVILNSALVQSYTCMCLTCSTYPKCLFCKEEKLYVLFPQSVVEVISVRSVYMITLFCFRRNTGGAMRKAKVSW